jgi:hypothetical protein
MTEKGSKALLIVSATFLASSYMTMMDSLHYFTMKPNKRASEQAGRLAIVGCHVLKNSSGSIPARLGAESVTREAVKRKSKGRTDEGVRFPHPASSRIPLLPASSASVIFQYFFLCFLVGGGQV